MDAFVVGAVPTYSQLIGGKLVASLMASEKVRRAYARKYAQSLPVISGERKKAKLVAITTTSALSRSSLYNRLRIPGGTKFIRIGATRGFGHFYLPGEVFEMMRRFLEQKELPYASGHRFGIGPNWKLRVARTALDEIGLGQAELPKHGIQREVYLAPLAKNWKEILFGRALRPEYITLPADEIAEYCLNGWIIPRGMRTPEYKSFECRTLFDGVIRSLKIPPAPFKTETLRRAH